jgi:hypothetical protein
MSGIGVLFQGSVLSMKELLVEDTAAEGRLDADGEGMFVSDATVDAEFCLFRRNVVAGLAAQGGAVLSLRSVEIAGTRLGSVRLLESSDTVARLLSGIGDGVLVVSSSATLERVYSHENARAGALFSDSGGSATDIWSHGNVYGLAVMGDPRPTYEADHLEGNSSTNVLTDHVLDVPEGPPPLPSAPEPPNE